MFYVYLSVRCYINDTDSINCILISYYSVCVLLTDLYCNFHFLVLEDHVMVVSKSEAIIVFSCLYPIVRIFLSTIDAPSTSKYPLVTIQSYLSVIVKSLLFQIHKYYKPIIIIIVQNKVWSIKNKYIN